MRSSKRRVDPFLPLEAVSFVLLYFLITILVMIVGFGVVEVVRGDSSTNVSIATIGDPEACVLVDPSAVPNAETTGKRRDGVSVRASELTICLQEPTLVQKSAAALKPVGDLVLVVVGLLLIRRAIRTGRRTRVFSLLFARQIQQLAWFILAAALVWPFVTAVGRGVVLEAVVPRWSWLDALITPGISIGLVFAGFGLLTGARILRRAVLLQEEVDETV